MRVGAEDWQRRSQGEPSLSPAFEFLAVEKADGFHGNSCDLHPDGGCLAGFLLTNLLQLARVEPVAGAVRAVVHLDLFPGAEEMAFELHAVAARTGTLAQKVHVDARVALDAQQMFRGNFALLVHVLEFKGVEPDAATSAVADISPKQPVIIISPYGAGKYGLNPFVTSL